MNEVKPKHYPTVDGGDCLAVIQQLGLSFSLGNAIKYIWRAGRRHQVDVVIDLKKAREYLDREIAYLEAHPPPETGRF